MIWVPHGSMWTSSLSCWSNPQLLLQHWQKRSDLKIGPESVDVDLIELTYSSSSCNIYFVYNITYVLQSYIHNRNRPVG